MARFRSARGFGQLLPEYMATSLTRLEGPMRSSNPGLRRYRRTGATRLK